MHKNIFFGIGAILAVLVFCRLANNLAFPDTNWKIGKDNSIALEKKDNLIQKFSAGRNGLSRIEIYLGKSRKTEGGKIILQVFDESCQNELRKTRIAEKPFDSDKTYAFRFSQISDSKDKTFCLKLSFEPLKGTKNQKVFVMNNPPAGNISLSLNGEEKQNQSLSMRPAYKNNNIWQNISELNQRISQYKPFFLKHYYLYTISFGFIILSILTTVLLILL